MNVLVANVGSSSVKLHVVRPDDGVARRTTVRSSHDVAAIEAFMGAADDYGAVGHRVVHGGTRFNAATVIDDDVLAGLDHVSDLAPLHNPPAVDLIRLVLHRDRRPHVACFDTAFHATIPDEASTYAVPAHWRDALGVRRFGFHGLSHAWASQRAATVLGAEPDDLRLVTCHLGAGASLAAIRGGRSVDTTMGFTPVEGLVMARRSGDVDPGALAWLVARGHVEPLELDRVLTHESGLFALAGTDDMREIEARPDEPRAALARRVYVHRLVKAIGAMAAVLGGVDAVVFTGGVGERSRWLRRVACEPLAFLGVHLDPTRNDSADPDTDGDIDISAAGAAVRTLVVRAREEVEIARQVRALIAARG